MEHQSESVSPAEDFSRMSHKYILHIHEMEENFNYPIFKVNRTETEFGEQVRIELYDYIAFAPISYNNKITDAEIKEYNTGFYYLKKVMNTNENYDLEFERVKFVSGYKKILNVADMLDHISYQIFEMQRKHTKYGENIQVDTLEHKIFLQKKFNGISDKIITEVNRGNYCIKKIPLNSTGFYRLEIQTVPINFHQGDVSLSETEIYQEMEQETEQNTESANEVTMETSVANPNERNSTSEGNVDLNMIIKEEANTNDTVDYSLIKNLTSYSDANKTIEDDEEGEVDKEGDVSASITDMVSPPNNANETEPKNINKFRCLLFPCKHVTNTEKTDISQEMEQESEQNIESANEVTMETPVANQNESYINNTITDDEEEEEVDDDGVVAASTPERGAMALMKYTNEVQPKSIIEFKCLLCPRKHVTKTEKTMLKHMRKFHGLDNIDNSEKIIRDQEKVTCKYCDLKYGLSYIYQHVRNQHSTERVTKARTTSKEHAAAENSLSTSFSRYICLLFICLFIIFLIENELQKRKIE